MQALLALALGTALTGIDVGWQPLEEGGLEYIVQIEPETLARLKPGDELATGIRPVLRDVRRYRIVIGKGPLPRIALPENPPTSSGATPPAPAPLATTERDRSIVVPAERVGVIPRPAADNSVRAPASSSATPPERIATAPLKLPAQPNSHGWQAVGTAKAESPVQPTESRPVTLKLEDPKITPPDALNLKANVGQPQLALPKAPGVAMPQASKDIEKKTPAAPPDNLGDRYRNVAPSPPIETAPPIQPKQVDPPAAPSSRVPAGDRYRDLLAPPAAQPQAAADRSPVRSTDALHPLAQQIVEKPEGTPRAAQQEFVGPRLPPVEAASPRIPISRPQAPPSLELAVEKPKAIAKPAVGDVSPLAENRLRGAEKSSRLLDENFGATPAILVSDPAVRPASAEPAPKPPVARAAAAPESAKEPAAAPWLPLTLTFFVLFASLGGNVFLGWMAHDARARYSQLLLQRRGLAGSPAPG